MLAKIYACALSALNGILIEVEVDSSPYGQPGTVIVGLPDTAVQESRERVRSALRNAKLPYPRAKVTINLAPADIRKEGPVFDLPIAVGILVAGSAVPCAMTENSLFIGELSLDGSVRHVRGMISIATTAKENGLSKLFVPACNAHEAALIPGLEIYPVDSLQQLYEHLVQIAPILPHEPLLIAHISPHSGTDFAEIKGQEHVKRALEIAASGAHNMLMSGPPGTGKTLLARALPSILPKMSLEEALDITRIYSNADMLPPDTPLIQTRPFRAPHHTISHAGLVGGGNNPRPGEISLAHRGILFLDEFPEFGSRVLEVLRQPLEDKVVTISRAAGSVTFPANFTLIAAMNPCPCGFYGDPHKPCICSELTISKYQRRISGPLLDRIDIHIDVPRIDFDKLNTTEVAESSNTIRERVEAAHAIQMRRFASLSNIANNSEMRPAEIRQYCRMTSESENMLKTAANRYQLSARAVHRLLKLARTIADLEYSGDHLHKGHIAEALQYRPRSVALH